MNLINGSFTIPSWNSNRFDVIIRVSFLLSHWVSSILFYQGFVLILFPFWCSQWKDQHDGVDLWVWISDGGFNAYDLVTICGSFSFFYNGMSYS